MRAKIGERLEQLGHSIPVPKLIPELRIRIALRSSHLGEVLSHYKYRHDLVQLQCATKLVGLLFGPFTVTIKIGLGVDTRLVESRDDEPKRTGRPVALD